MRVLGATKRQLTVVFLPIVFTAIPAAVLGLLLSFLFEQFVSSSVSSVLQEPVSLVSLASKQQLYSIFAVGVAIPFAAQVLKLRKALMSSELRKLIVPLSIRSFKEKYVDSVRFQVRRLEKYGLDFWGVAISLALIANGYLAFYLLPQMLVNNEVTNFLSSANLVFFVLIGGLSIMFNLVQLELQKLLAKVLLNVWNWVFKSQRIERSVLVYNLKAHSGYTRQLSLILILVTTLLIFVGTGSKVHSQSVAQAIMTNVGSDLSFEVKTGYDGKLSELQIREYLIEFGKK